jgi:hypothetical protein
MTRSSECSISFKLCKQHFVLIYARYLPGPSQPPWFDHPDNVKMVSCLLGYCTVKCDRY